MPLLSIIIPVHNVQNYIEECLESILSQDYNDYEVILIDDASTDRSGTICDSYASKHNNIRVIHLEKNSLPAGARNAGISIAVGEYIHFCDSDDYYVEGCFSRIAQVLDNSSPEVLMGQFICIPEKGAFVCNDIKLNPEMFINSNSHTMAEYLLSIPKLMCTPWRFVLKRDFLINNNLWFLEGYHVEDEEWFPRVICCAENYALLTSPMYCYRPRATGSVTSQKTYIISKSQLVMSLSLLSFLKGKDYKDSRRDFILFRARFLLGLFSTRCDSFNRTELHDLANQLESYKDSLHVLCESTQPYDLFSFVKSYGAYIGLCLYRTYVIEKTLGKVYGHEKAEIYVFPTGFNGEGTARILRNVGYNVKGFLDNSESKNGCLVDGLPVNLPTVLRELSPDILSNIFVLVTIQQEHIAAVLMEQLRELGLNDSQFTTRTY